MPIYGSSRSLLTRFEVGQDSEDLYAQFEVRQDSAELLGKGDVQQSGSAELLGKAEITHSVDLLGKGDIRQSSFNELLGKAEVQQSDSAELLGKAGITHSTELLCNAIIKNTGSAALYARAEVRQDSKDLFAKFEAQDTQVLYAKSEIRQADLGELYARTEVGQGSDELFAKAVVGQGSVELFGRGIVRDVGSADLLGRFEAQATAELLGRTVIGHPAFPVWLKAIFLIGLTNAYQDLGSRLEIGRTAFAELLGRFEAQASAELLCKAEVKNIGSAELLGKAVIRHVGTAETLGKAVIKALSSADLGASVMVRVTKDSGTYFSFWDPSDWINEVVGVGQGFIAIPWVEADADVKTSGNSSARLTSTSNPGQYKEIRFGWGGMNWGVEVAVSPEVAPTPIDTDGRGPRRGSRASRDRRREVPQSSYNDLPARLFVTRQAFNDLAASFNIVALSVSIIQLTTWAASVYATPAYASVLGVGFAGTLDAGDTYKFDWDAMVRSWVSDNDVCFRMTVTPDGEAKQVLGSEMKDDPPSGFMGPGLDGVCPVSLSRVFTAALDGNFTFNVEMKASSSADVFWQNLVATLVKP
jgi:hypothetical protein